MSVSSVTSFSSILYECDEESYTDEGSWHSCETKEGKSLSKLHEKLLEQVKRSTKMASSLEKQISAFDEYNGGFEHWYKEKFKLALKDVHQRYLQEKNLDAAYELKKMAEAYFEWQNTEKAFDYINRAIKAVPRDEKSLLGNCFALRAELHMQLTSDVSSALADLEKALLCRPNSYSCIRRKVDILTEAKRNVEAFSFLDEILNKTDRAKITALQMDRLHQLHAALSQYEPENESTVKQTAATDEEQKNSSASVVSIDKRLKMVQNGSHKRYGLFAAEDIASRSSVITEQPALMALKDDGRKQFCSSCWRSCKNTFWPCCGCTEVQYCSQKCATEDETKGYHAAFCGFLQHLQLENSTNVHSIMVLQYLLQHGHEKMVAVMNVCSESAKLEEEEAFPLDECFNEVASGSQTMTAEQLSASFFRRQSFLLRNFNQSGNLYSKRNSHHIAYAVYILSLYMHYAKLEPASLGKATIQGLLCLLSIQLYSVALGEYSWTNRTSGGEKTSNASFLCLFSSTIGHSCKANAEWLFTSDGNFVLRTTAPVDAGTEIAISYGVNSSDTPSVYTRLATLSRFGCLCACASCLADSTTAFALQCRQGICRGPVPWSGTSFPNDLCIICEQKHPDIEVAKTIQKEMESAKTAICLLFVVDDSSDSTYVQQVEAKLTKIAAHIYPHNTAFQAMVLDLCEYYMSRGMHRQAVNWFHWFAIEQDIFLSADGNGGSSVDTKKKDDSKVESLLTHFHFLDKWCNAYLCVLESEMSKTGPKQQTASDSFSSHLDVANKLLTHLNGIIISWASLSPSTASSCSTFLDSIGSDMQQMGDHLSALSNKHSRRYMTLISQIMDAAISQSPLIKVVRDASSTAFDFNADQQKQPLPLNVKMPEDVNSGPNSVQGQQKQQQQSQSVDSDDELEIYVVGRNSSSESVKADK